MKSIATFILCSLLAFSVAAQSTSSVTFFAAEGEKFWVIMDGIKQNEKADANVKVTGLDKPNYVVKIIFADSKLGSFNKSIVTRDYEDKFFDSTYKISKNKKGAYVAQVSSFSESRSGDPANASVVPHTDVEPKAGSTGTTGAGNVGINQNVNMTGTGANTSQTITTPDGDNVRMDMNMGATGGGVTIDDGSGEKVNMNIGINVTGMDAPTSTTNTSTTVTRTTTTTYSNSSGTRPPVNQQPIDSRPNTPPPPAANNSGCTFPASSTDFGNLKGSVQKQSFSENKMNAAKAFLKAKCLSVAQIKEVMGLFSFEGDKLDFAKFAYDRCSDKDNYFMVGDAFSFSTSQDDLMEYINGK